ncbi:ADP-heptose:LPS heptosyltransferase [Orbus hercynius]|uniref:ADP-heptose:LPS heptosyltransferase n=1 Tax=Orbus hercynius TaxID=593135 RepID=A0A495RKL5_9GAMM|nr:glycosyltransferase family 9 protein [Orbus hercynius]RKS87706.1 ADP-heptose:LPS heptosyltransferase [Orbus hercynius]
MKRFHRKIKSYLRNIRLFLGRFILDKKPSRKWDPALLATSKILFIRHDGKIGDFIVSSFVYREIKKQYPNIHIGIVSACETQDLFKTDPHIDSLYITPQRALLPFWLIARKIAKENYDIVVDLTDFLRNRDIVLIRYVNAAINIGYNQTELKLFNRNIQANNEHITLDYESAMMILGLQKMDRHYSFPNIPITEELLTFCQQYLSKAYIAINFFGAANHKKFSTEQQIKWLTRLNLVYPDKIILILTYPKVTNELKPLLINDKYVMYEGTQTIFDSIELIKHASMVISPDTSIIHAASALNRPIIAFYMSSNPQNPYRKWLPMNAQNAMIYYYENNINEIDIATVKLPVIQGDLDLNS